jgi:hypothetical protein
MSWSYSAACNPIGVEELVGRLGKKPWGRERDLKWRRILFD